MLTLQHQPDWTKVAVTIVHSRTYAALRSQGDISEADPLTFHGKPILINDNIAFFEDRQAIIALDADFKFVPCGKLRPA
jgi:hypothetical protein